MNSGFDFLQRPISNEPALDDEVPHIRSFRQDCQARIDSVNHKIEQLLNERKLLEEDLERYDTLLAPVKRIPDDVLQTIFQHTLCTIPTDFQVWHWRRTPPAVVPSQICRHWRQLALLTPALWTTIPVIPPDHPMNTQLDPEPPHVVEMEARGWEVRTKQLLGILSLWIKRAGRDPLSVILELKLFCDKKGQGGEKIREAAFALHQGLLDLVRKVAFRWKKLDVTVDANDSATLDMLMALKSDDVPLLEVITFEAKGSLRTWNHALSPTGIFMAKRLRSFTMLRLGGLWAGLSINWAAVTELQLGVEDDSWGEGEPLHSSIEQSFGPDATRSMLLMCPQLERWKLSVQSSDTSLPASVRQDRQENVQHAHIKTLIFHGSLPSEALASSLDLPSLRQVHFLSDLAVRVRPEGRDILSLRLIWFADCHGSQLTDLRFNHLLLSDVTSITRCFGSLPHLLSLPLDGGVPAFGESTKDMFTTLSNAAMAILVALTPEAGEDQCASRVGPLCPKLKRFVYQPMLQCFTEGQLLDFVVARSRITTTFNGDIARIEEVDVHFNVAQEMDIPSELKSKGVDVDYITLRVKYPKPRGL